MYVHTRRISVTAGVPPPLAGEDPSAGVWEGVAEASGWGQGGQRAADGGSQKVGRSHGS